MNKKVYFCKCSTLLVREEVECKYDAASNKADSVEGAVAFLTGQLNLAEKVQEEAWALYLNPKMEIIGYQLISLGTATQTYMTPPDVFRSAIACSATAVIVAHCHPSGNPSPSEEDINATTALKYCGKMLGIQLVDHIIIGKVGSYFSFKEKNLVLEA